MSRIPFQIPEATDADFALEAEISTALELIAGATCETERQSGMRALTRLVKSRSDCQALRIEFSYQNRKCGR